MVAIFVAALFLVVPVCVGAAAIAIFGRGKKTSMPVGLLLHTLSRENAPHCSYYSPGKFEELIARCSREGFISSTVSMAKNAQSAKTIVLTFDDGFESFFTLALPVLQKYNFKVTVFPVAGYLGKTSTWDTLPPQIHLTKEQILEIISMGHEIGSHTVSHANLTFLSDKDLKAELSCSKQILEDCTGRPVTSLSFPFGQWNKRVWDTAQTLGYTAATSYANSNRKIPGVIPLFGIYSFDSVQDVWNRAIASPVFSNALARGYVMPHFAKGTPLWKFRETYRLLRR
jgi:peptidoglycan/xylan/chitin deacetylase (PgdA/CDA1 family)